MEKISEFPSRLQSKILAAIYFAEGEYVTTEMILKQTGIAQSTWSEEQNRLIANGLIEKKQSKVMSSKVITRIMNYKLTEKGRLVAHNLSNISRIMAPGQFVSKEPVRIEKVAREEMRMSYTEIEQTLLECIEVGLESFGMNLDKLVKEEIQAEGMSWEEITKNPDRLVFHLNELFGRGGALTIEQMISANIKSRFDLRSIASDSLYSIINELKASYPKISSLLKN
jgi:DNA-binding MarR family transcriptional regulator